MITKRNSLLVPDNLVAVNGYRGDRLTRVILIDRVYDNRVVGLDETRNQFRSYLFREIGSLRKVKVDD